MVIIWNLEPTLRSDCYSQTSDYSKFQSFKTASLVDYHNNLIFFMGYERPSAVHKKITTPALTNLVLVLLLKS